MNAISKNAAPRRKTPEQLTAALAEHVELSPTEWADFRKFFTLSQRQLQVAKLIFADCPSKVLARRLGCARSTAGGHRAALYAKLQVNDHASLVRKILEFCIAHRGARSNPPSLNICS